MELPTAILVDQPLKEFLLKVNEVHAIPASFKNSTEIYQTVIGKHKVTTLAATMMKTHVTVIGVITTQHN